MSKIKVPEGMLKAFHRSEAHDGLKWDDNVLENMLEAALRWLSDNPIVPTRDDVLKMNRGWHFEVEIISAITEWQRRMFLAPEPEIPEEVKDLLWSETLYAGDQKFFEAVPRINENVIEAFRRGQRSAK